jgi:hypothetical protein
MSIVCFCFELKVDVLVIRWFGFLSHFACVLECTICYVSFR